MEAFLEKFEHDLKVFSYEEIKSITGDFDENNVIGKGGFGKVYRGVVESNSKGKIMAAFKRLDSSCGQGNPEFMKEIMMLSRYRHDNLILLLGYCDENHEKILVYEYAANGSLDAHLSSTTLTWTQRLEICLGAAKGLCYLHDPKETHERVIHRDIKSSNILLDENWNAKISDMGLSKIGPANQLQSFLATNIVGTFFYLDPAYMVTSILTKESDIFSFGVVLFEVLCGSLCFEHKEDHFESFVPSWRKSYKQEKLEEIIFPHLKQDMDMRSLETFSDIAYGCLQKSRAQRPNMSQVVEKLEIALQIQQEISKMELEEMVKAAVNIEELEMLLSTTFLNNQIFKEMVQAALNKKKLDMFLSEKFFNIEISEREFEEIVEAVVNKEELQKLVSKRFINKEEQELFLSKGVLVNGGNTWFSLNKNGEHCEVISGNCFEFTSTDEYGDDWEIEPDDVKNSRFKVHKQNVFYIGFKAHVRAQYLSPGITYTINLVFKLRYANIMGNYEYLRYMFAGETNFSTSFIPQEREDGWMMTDHLCHFICDNENVDLDITFNCYYPLLVEGIEIKSLDKVQHEQVLDEVEVDTHLDTYWEQKLPKNWEEIVKWSKDSVQWTTKKELYSILHKGLLFDHGREWFSLANNGKNIQMTSARYAFNNGHCDWKSLPESRFRETACDPVGEFRMSCYSLKLSPETTYVAYFVYKLEENHPRFKSPVEVDVKKNGKNFIDSYIYLLSPDQCPGIRGKVYQKKRIPQQRNDGWTEVPVYEFQTNTESKDRNIFIKFKASDNTSLKGLIVEGIDFRPI